MNYGKAVKIARAVAGMSQRELALEAKLDASHISLIEKGERKPSVDALQRLAKALGIPQHLFALLGAEPSDLRNIDGPELGRISESLARYLIGEIRPREHSRRSNPTA
jgi:transcriptional regulator with XRE-family HTH domain